MTKQEMRLIVANWKMNPETMEEARRLASRVEHGIFGSGTKGIEVAICPPFVFLPALRHYLHHVKLGSQNVSAFAKGPHTGEISALQLKVLGVRYVIVGHSERRAMGEDDKLFNKKLLICLENKLHPIFCVGYGTTKSTTPQAEKKIISTQLQTALKGLRFAKDELTVAYEPAWTISKGPGTARPIAAEHAAEMISFVKKKYNKVRVIYGASITGANCTELASYDAIEGGLVGGASLDGEEFLNIIKAFS